MECRPTALVIAFEGGVRRGGGEGGGGEGEGGEGREQICPCTKCSLHACSFTLCLSFAYLRSAVAASLNTKKFLGNATRIKWMNVVTSSANN